jgi:hypothetical protein
MNYGRVRRGPMAADAFTQIKNNLFRDKRLTFRDKGIFGLISTHREGFGVTAESIAACSPTDGVSAVKSSLRNLETYGYLQRTRERRKDGTLGGAVYFITDDPEALAGMSEEAMALESPRSQPAVPEPTLAEPTQAQPALAGPPVAEPTLADRPHKKTNSKHTSLKNILSPPELPPAAAEPPAAPDEREIFAKTMNDNTAKVAEAWSVARGGRRNSASEEKVRASAASLLAVGWSIPDLIALAEDMAAKYPAGTDLTKHEAHWSAEHKPSAVQLPPWCGCGGNPAAEFNGKFRTHNGTAKGQPCLICHPDALQESA